MSYRSSLSQRRLEGIYFQNSSATDWPITETNTSYIANLQYVLDFVQSAYSGFLTVLNPIFTGLLSGPSITLTDALSVPTITSNTNFTAVPTITVNNTVYNVSTVPVGTIKMFISNISPPAGYIPCDGASYATTAYPALYAVIGFTYGGSGATFNVPNLQSYFPIGGNSSNALGCSTSNYATGNGTSGATNTYSTTSNFGGASTAIAPLITKVPPHTHDITDSGHNHAAELGEQFVAYIPVPTLGLYVMVPNQGNAYPTGLSVTNILIDNTGTGIQATDPISGLAGVNVSPPYVAVFYYIAI
jgi:microcystin-dependent protein